MTRLAFLVLCGLVAVAPQLGPLGGDAAVVSSTSSASSASSSVAPKPVEVVRPVEIAPLALPKRACGDQAVEVQPVSSTPAPVKPPPRLGLGTCDQR